RLQRRLSCAAERRSLKKGWLPTLSKTSDTALLRPGGGDRGRRHGGGKTPQAEQALRSDGRCGAIDRFVGIVWIGRRSAPVSQSLQAGCSGVPVRDSVGRGVLDIEIAGGAGSFFQDLVAAGEFE